MSFPFKLTKKSDMIPKGPCKCINCGQEKSFEEIIESRVCPKCGARIFKRTVTLDSVRSEYLNPYNHLVDGFQGTIDEIDGIKPDVEWLEVKFGRVRFGAPSVQ